MFSVTTPGAQRYYLGRIADRSSLLIGLHLGPDILIITLQLLINNWSNHRKSLFEMKQSSEILIFG